jgi:hypothetical protein
MPREGALDSAFLAFTTKLVSEQVERINSGFRSYDPAVFIAEIRRMLDSKAGMNELAARTRSYSLVTDNPTFMLGPMEVEVKARRAREVRKKDTIAESVRPEDVDNLEADEKNEVTKRVELLAEHLPNDMNYWKYMFDGTDGKGFGRTIENLFYSSFLVRDGHAGLDVRNGQPFIVPHAAPSEDDYVERRVIKHQCVVQFDYPMWLALSTKLGHTSYLPAPTTEALPYPAPIASSQTNENGKTKKADEVVSPNSKKRNRKVLDSDDEEMVSQVAATPEEAMPKTKKPKGR